ncbi:hypothetical protein HZC34_07315 [Candidatus Saganbacteria bacterium]|nr:hypothetical protein [Candidatus Saganbacteria bacterium]
MSRNFALVIFSALFIGSGQILKGETEKGIKIMLAFYFGVPLILYFTLGISGGLFVIVFGITIIFTVLFWLYNIWDAAR